MARSSRKPTRSLFAQAVKAHTSGDQVQDVDLTDVDLPQSTQKEQTLSPQEVDLTDVDVSAPSTKAPRRATPLSGETREEMAAKLRAEELQEQLYLRADAKAKQISSRPEFQPGHGFYTLGSDPSEHGASLKLLKEGKGTLNPLSVKGGYGHVKTLHQELVSFVDNLPSLLRAKADAHDKAAAEIEKIYAEHPEVENHRLKAANIRGFLGEGPDVRNNLREVRDSNSTSSLIQDNSRSFERTLTPIKNDLVEAKSKIDVIPLTEKEREKGETGAFSQNTKRTHGAIKKAQSALVSLHGKINKLVRPFEVGTPTGPAYLELRNQQIDNLVDKPSRPDVSGYQDVRYEFEPGAEGRLSKPGHIWGDEITVGGRRTGDREQIPISEENVQMLRGRKGGKKHATRMSSILRTGKSPEEKSQETAENKETSLFSYSPEAEEQQMVRLKAAGRLIDTEEGPVAIPSGGAPRTQRRQGNKVKSVLVDPKKVTTEGTHRGAVQQISSMRAAKSETQGHIDRATRALIDGTDVPSESISHFESLPGNEGNEAAQQAFDRAEAHGRAVTEAIESVKSTGRISKEHRDLFKREGTDVGSIVRQAKGL